MASNDELGIDGDVRCEFTTAADNDDGPPWRVRSMVLEEGLSEPYACHITLAVHQDDWTAPELLGKPATLRWERQNGTERALQGILEWVHPHGLDGEEILTEVRLAPALTALQHRSDSRVFEGKTAVEVAIAVLEEDLGLFSRKVTPKLDPKAYPKREYVVQHRESNLDFVSRLLAEEGAWFYFNHPLDSLAPEELILCDANDDAVTFEDGPLALSDMVQRDLRHEAVIAMSRADQLRPTKVAVRQFNWGNPDVPDEAEGADDESEVELALYDPDDVGVEDGGGKPAHTPDNQATRRLQARSLDKKLVHMTTLYAGLQSGMTVHIDHELDALRGDYLIMEVHHSFKAEHTGGRTGFIGKFENRLVALPAEHEYRPARLDKPRIHGLQTATVVGPDRATLTMSDLHTDDHGRIRVKFSWDRTSHDAEGSISCWTRVAQMWGGPGWGSQFIPRIGMEVVVSFIDGDPDRPLVVGSVYNGRNAIPHADPTHSGLRTSSIPDGSGFNELRFEDAAGSERIYVHAQHNLDEEILNDHSTTVKGKQSNTVSKSQSESIGGSQSLSVEGKRTKTVGGKDENGEEITIKGERSTTVTQKHTEVFKNGHEVTVSTSAVTETYENAHNRYVTGDQTLECESNRIEHISGNYELSTDLKFNLTQNGTSLTFEGDKVALDAASAISIKRGPATVDIDDAGNVVIATSAGISFECGGSKLVISPSAVEIEAMQVSVTAGPSSMALTPASAEMKSVNTNIEATAVCSVKGTGMLTLN